MSSLTHFNKDGRANMVDVGEKQITLREAVAGGTVRVNAETFKLITQGKMQKGDVFAVAQVAGIMAAKRTPDIIPMCHPIRLTGADISFTANEDSHSIDVFATVRCKGETGVEMEALTAVSAAALTIYDMCKAVQKDIEITNIRLVNKTGGASGNYTAHQNKYSSIVAAGTADEQRLPLQIEHTHPAGAAICHPHKVPTVKAVCISEQKGTIKIPVNEIRVQKNYGIVGDAHGGDGHRQISLLANESVDTLRDKVPNLDAGVFAENILTSGICLHELPIGTKILIGDVQLIVTQIGKACHNDGCAIKRQTGDCVMPREGIFASALTDGIIKPGDEIILANN